MSRFQPAKLIPEFVPSRCGLTAKNLAALDKQTA